MEHCAKRGEDFPSPIDTNPFSGNLLRGFGGTSPRLKFDIVYNDGFETPTYL